MRYLAKKFQTEHGDEIPVIQTMDMSDYAMQKADKIFEQAYKAYQAKEN